MIHQYLKFKWIGVLLIVLLSACSSMEAEWEDVKNTFTKPQATRADDVKTDTIASDAAGSLYKLGSEGRIQYSGVKKMILKGKFNEKDIQYIRDSLDVTILDMTDVNFQESYIQSGCFNIPTDEYWSFNDGGFTQIILPKEGVNSIWNYAFSGCSSLTSITIPEGVESIARSAFRGCSSLTSITIPEKVTNIWDYAFSGCTSLTSITIPKNVTSIGYGAFYNCSSLTSITIPEGVTSIGKSAFDGCSSLTSITIPEEVTSIEAWVFSGCNSLTSITIPKNVTSIGYGAFHDCSSLISISIPDKVSSIDSEAFYDCSSLTNITIPKGVTSIARSAFRGCSSLTSITIPENVTSIGHGAFLLCSSLTSITIPNGVTKIEESVFYGCSSLTNITIPKGVTSIARSTLEDCNSLTTITIPEGVTSIGDRAFSGCSSLASITIPEGVTNIGNGTFSGCSSLASITIPEGVTNIGDNVLWGCTSLQYILCKSDLDIKRQFEGNCLLAFETDGKFTPANKGEVNVVVDGVCDILDLNSLDITSEYFKYIEASQKVVYDKDFTEYYSGWYTLTLPFTPTSITDSNGRTLAPFDADVDGALNFWLRDLTPDGFIDVTTIEPNHPYIIAMPTSSYSYNSEFLIYGNVTFSAENISFKDGIGEMENAQGPGYTMYPTYETMARARDIYVLNSEYEITNYDYGSVFVHSTLEVSPYEAYIKMDDTATTMRSLLPVQGKRTAVRGAKSDDDATSRGADGLRKPRKDDM